MALEAAPGDYLPTGSVVAQLRNQEDKPHQAVLQVAPRMAKRLRAGMPASVEVVTPDGTIHEVDGEIVSVISGPLPHWLATFRPEGMDYAHRVDIAFHSGPDLVMPDGTPCRASIMLGRHSLVTLLGLKQL